jgi:protein-tyrosine phosphatase
MDTSNYRNLLRLASSEEDSVKIKLILDYSYPNKKASVPDPYYGGSNGFESVYHLLDQACEEIIQKLIN